MAISGNSRCVSGQDRQPRARSRSHRVWDISSCSLINESSQDAVDATRYNRYVSQALMVLLMVSMLEETLVPFALVWVCSCSGGRGDYDGYGGCGRGD